VQVYLIVVVARIWGRHVIMCNKQLQVLSVLYKINFIIIIILLTCPVRGPFNVSFIMFCIPPVLARNIRCRQSHVSPPTNLSRVARPISIPKRSGRDRTIEQLTLAARGRRQYSFKDTTMNCQQWPD